MVYNFLYIIYIKSGGRRGIDCFSKEKQSTSYHDVDDIMVTLPKKWGGNGRGLEEGYVPDPPNIPPLPPPPHNVCGGWGDSEEGGLSIK